MYEYNQNQGANNQAGYNQNQGVNNQGGYNQGAGNQNNYGQGYNQSGYNYNTTTPGQPGRPVPPEPEKKPMMGFGKLAILAAIFGVVTGGSFAGINALTNKAAVKEPAAIERQAETGATESGEKSGKLEMLLPIEEDGSAEVTEPQTGAIAAPAVSIGNDVSGIVEKAMPSVVAINVTQKVKQNSFWFGVQEYEAQGAGSGFIANEDDNDYYIVTNNHVVAGANNVKIVFIDGEEVEAVVRGTDEDADLAVVSVKKTDVADDTKKEIKVAELGDSDELKLGQGVVAIGNALGMGQSVTVGYVSALNREITIDGVSKSFIQVDAAINPGNSGGALLNMYGKVIGINSAKTSNTAVEGVGYAIPISYAKDIINELMTKQPKITVDEKEQGYLGIQLQNIDAQTAKAYNMPEGVFVYKIIEGSGAEKSDLKERDIIVKFDGEKIHTGEELRETLTYYKAGQTIDVTVQRLGEDGYEEKVIPVTLGEKPAN